VLQTASDGVLQQGANACVGGPARGLSLKSDVSHLRVVEPRSAAEAGEPSDDYLMSLAAEGQQQAFATLVRRHEKKLRGFCELLLQDAAGARETAQEVFLKIWVQRGRYRPEGRFRELLFTIARNRCRSVHRRRRLLELVSMDSTPAVKERLPSEHMSTPEEMERGERAALVRGALQKLPEKFRAPLALRFLEDMPYDEIARVIGRTESAARSRIHYGLKALEQLLPDEVRE
jgi:RNA polymerase sigma-70 factor, ECF subfamily